MGIHCPTAEPALSPNATHAVRGRGERSPRQIHKGSVPLQKWPAAAQIWSRDAAVPAQTVRRAAWHYVGQQVPTTNPEHSEVAGIESAFEAPGCASSTRLLVRLLGRRHDAGTALHCNHHPLRGRFHGNRLRSCCVDRQLVPDQPRARPRLSFRLGAAILRRLRDPGRSRRLFFCRRPLAHYPPLPARLVRGGLLHHLCALRLRHLPNGATRSGYSCHRGRGG